MNDRRSDCADAGLVSTSDYDRARSPAERCIRPPKEMTAAGVAWTLWLLSVLIGKKRRNEAFSRE